MVPNGETLDSPDQDEVVPTVVGVLPAALETRQGSGDERQAVEPRRPVDVLETIDALCGEPGGEITLIRGEHVDDESVAGSEVLERVRVLPDGEKSERRVEREGAEGVRGETGGLAVSVEGGHHGYTGHELAETVSKFSPVEITHPGTFHWDTSPRCESTLQGRDRFLTVPTDDDHAAVKSPWPWILLATAGWASGNVTSKLALNGGMDPISLTLVRFAIAATGMVAILAAVRRLDSDHDWRRGGAIGVLNMALPPIFFTIALVTLDASLAGLLIALIPAASIVAAHFIVPGERFRMWRVPGLVVAFTGIGILLGGVDRIDPDALWSAVGWSLLGVVAAGSGGAVSRRFALHTPARRMVVPQFSAAAVTLVIVGIPTGAWGALDGLPGDVWGWAIATGLFGTITPFYSFLQVIERAETARAALIGYLVPVASAISAVIFLGDPVTASLLIGGGVIIAGVVLADRGESLFSIIRTRKLEKASAASR